MSESILQGYVDEHTFARDEVRKDIRTVRRWRNQPDGLPHLKLGRDVYIPVEEARSWLKSKIVTPNPLK
jgi:hypothetical protein